MERSPALGRSAPSPKDVAVDGQYIFSNCLPIICQLGNRGFFGCSHQVILAYIVICLRVEGAQGLEPWTR